TPNPATKDSENNVEKIIIHDPEDGFYTFTVRSYDLYAYTDGQDFALVVSPMIGVDSAVQNKSYWYNFTDSSVHASVVGLPPSDPVDILVVKYDGSPWPNLKPLAGLDISGGTESATSDTEGKINVTEIWKGPSNWIYYGAGDGRFNIGVGTEATL